jgi:hypothetical protein
MSQRQPRPLHAAEFPVKPAQTAGVVRGATAALCAARSSSALTGQAGMAVPGMGGSTDAAGRGQASAGYTAPAASSLKHQVFLRWSQAEMTTSSWSSGQPPCCAADSRATCASVQYAGR